MSIVCASALVWLPCEASLYIIGWLTADIVPFHLILIPITPVYTVPQNVNIFSTYTPLRLSNVKLLLLVSCVVIPVSLYCVPETVVNPLTICASIVLVEDQSFLSRTAILSIFTPAPQS